MGLFKHRTKTPEFVFVDGAWQTFAKAMYESWVDLAAEAWSGYQTSGRGFVVVNFSVNQLIYLTASLGVVLADRERIIRTLQGDCKRYSPKREIVLLIEDGARNAKSARSGSVERFGGVIPTPHGWASPPESNRLAAGYELGNQQNAAEGGIMPLFGKRKREESKKVPSPEQITEAATHMLAVRRLWLNGQLDLALRGRIDDGNVFVEMADVHGTWVRVAAQAWRGYETNGRGFLLLNSATRQLNYYTLEAGAAPPWLPAEIAHYCASYDPRTDLVIAIYGFADAGDPEASAALWMRPPDTWVAPPAAWQQWQQMRG